MKKTRTLILTAAIGLAAALSVQAQTLIFDFGNSSFPTGPNYNDILTSNGGTPNAIDSLGSLTGIALSSSGFNAGANGNGTLAPSGAAAIFASSATRDSFFGHVAVFTGGTGPGGTSPLGILSLTGLNPTATYDFTFFGSRTGVADNRETKYEVVGLNTAFGLLNTANNTANVAVVSGISPDAFGNLTVNVTKGPNNNNGSGFFYLGAMQIVAVPEPSSMTLATLGGFGVMLAGRRFRSSRS